jgi:nucleoside-diphosphate-sugar epimerase
MIGGHAALRLADGGDEVVIAGRNPAPAGSPLATLPFCRLNFLEPAEAEVFEGVDAVVFAAGNDVRHAPARSGPEADAHFLKTNGEAVPAFLAAAKRAGVQRAVLIGSFYPQAAPELVATSAYVRSRLAADEGARALADASFHVSVLNAPFVIGEVPGLIVPSADAMARWALGVLDIPRAAPPGGVNVISCDTLSDAIQGALHHARNGHAYLIGDENLTFAEYLGLYWRGAGDDRPLEVIDASHPFLPDSALLRGRGATIYYDADPAEVAELGYRRNDVARTCALIVEAARARLA